MTKQIGSLGGRDDITLAADLPALGRWRPVGTHYLEADEVSDPGEFPLHGYYLESELLEDGEEHYVQVTETLDGTLVEWMEEHQESLQSMSVAIEEAVKRGDEETATWHYVVDIQPVGPPE